MTEFVALFYGVDGSLKSSVEDLIPILGFIPLKKTVSMVYDVVQSY